MQHRFTTKKTMARVGWNFGEEFAAAPAFAPMGSAWSGAPSESVPASDGQARIGFVFDEVAGSPRSPESPTETPAEGSQSSNGIPNSNLLHPSDTTAHRAFSFNAPKRPPPPRLHDFSSASYDVPEREKPNLSERSKSLAQSRCGNDPLYASITADAKLPMPIVYPSPASSRNSEAYQQGLADMADLMTTVDLSEAEKQKIRDRFALDK
ncbi:unnamed protein product [Hydatigera taeniaeformis]|uniref:Uncharacterized protein n=1 Tax=Hydatigena taeniaeformis TaxID=6205 RepID=A0A3P7H7G1_HYDTA|nr:unnamed protein product [Hydatigera taeniaeformis]